MPNLLPLNAKGYNQTYIVRSADVDADEHDTWACRETLFRCGNYCYEGVVKLSYQNAFEMTLKGSCFCIALSFSAHCSESLFQISPILYRKFNSNRPIYRTHANFQTSQYQAFILFMHLKVHKICLHGSCLLIKSLVKLPTFGRKIIG